MKGVRYRRKETRAPKMSKWGDLFFSENTGAFRTKFIRNVFSSIGISHTKNKRHKGIKMGLSVF
jgi:hypothetical protein